MIVYFAIQTAKKFFKNPSCDECTLKLRFILLDQIWYIYPNWQGSLDSKQNPYLCNDETNHKCDQKSLGIRETMGGEKK